MKYLTIVLSKLDLTRHEGIWSDSTDHENFRSGSFTYPAKKDHEIIERFMEEGYRINVFLEHFSIGEGIREVNTNV